MARKQSWPEDLHEYVDSRANTPFAWGSNDCCFFAADAALAMTGEDPAEEFRGKYADEDGAKAIIETITGGSTTEDAVAWVGLKRGWEELSNILMAQRGDLVLVEVGSSLAAGIVYLNGKDCLFVSTDGLHRLPLRKCKRAWRVI
jgi:hypothetical protein